MENKRIYLSPPYQNGREKIFANEAFDSNWIAPIGPQVDAFEREICEYTGALHAAALSSGTAALHLALILAGVKQGDDVVCSSFTFAGSAFPITYLGATPVFVDSEESTWNISPTLFEEAVISRKKIGKTIRAAVVVHLYGQSADLDPIAAICEKHGIVLIEDAAESLGATYKDRFTGSIARFGILSFNGNKIITASGGGMLVGKSKDEIDHARYLATQARDPAPYYQHTSIGFNYRMSSICAAVGRGQLTDIEFRVQRRREIFARYAESLLSIDGISFMPEAGFGRSNRWLTCMLIDPEKIHIGPEELRLSLEAKNIESRPLWKPMHLQPVFADAPAFIDGTSQRLFRTGICLPSGTAMTDAELDKTVSCIIVTLNGK